MISLLGLQDCQTTPVGGIIVRGMSTGEKRRTSIGYELITRPLVCILDEPTSGLDSHSAYNVIKHLHKLAKLRGTTVICSIH
jgi:ABC-type multidrug transport system ATPase subunit